MIAPGIDEVDRPRSLHGHSLFLELSSHGVLVVDDKPKVPRAVGRLGASLHEREELIAHVDEGRLCARAPAKLHVKETLVPSQSLVDVGDLERHVVDSDQSCHPD